MKEYMPYIIMILGVLFALAPSYGEKHKAQIDDWIRCLRSKSPHQ